jgi:hypothetical protein
VIDQPRESFERESDPVPDSEGDGEQRVGIIAKDVAAYDDIVLCFAEFPEVGSVDVPAIVP